MTKTGYFYGYPYIPANKNFSYHGIILPCNKIPEIAPFDEKDTPLPSDEAYFVFTTRVVSCTYQSALLEGELVAMGPGSFFKLKGFLYYPEGSEEYLISFELGEFTSQFYQQEADLGKL